ncbi:MAG: acyltransferase [Donghicola eburneus]|nr:acyltransferase [Donghicola eburneus]MCI5042829.1 acyltransferase [Donghicola eburneus]
MKLHSIQYLRALAALAVVGLHASKRVEDQLPEAAIPLFQLGHAGVDLFFVISGFIIWFIGRGSQQDPATFLMRRVLRIAPMYWGATLLWLLMVQATGAGWISITPEHVIQSLTFIPHFNATFPERIWPVLIPGWTLNYEMFFYLVFASMLILPERQRLLAIVFAMLGLVSFGMVTLPSSALAQAYTSPMLLEFAAGCLVAELWFRAQGGPLRNVLMIGLGVSLFAIYGPGVAESDHWSRALFFGIPAALVLSGVVGLGAAIPAMPRLEQLGDASYAIYLFHVILLVPAERIWSMLPALHGSQSGFVFIAVYLAMTCVIGVWIFDRVETPMQRSLGKFVSFSKGKQAYEK